MSRRSIGVFARVMLAQFGAMVLILGLGERVFAVDVSCGTGEGDGFGWSVDAGADLDGDGTVDIAVGAPCASVGGLAKVGRVRVFSGVTGRRLLSLTGELEQQQFGAAVALVPDVNGDGKAELAIGSSTFDVPKEEGGTIKQAGKLELFSSVAGVSWTFSGTTQDATVGESVTAIADVNGDGKADLIVGGSGVRVTGERRGTAFILSGASGALLGRNDGENEFDYWASALGVIGDVDTDGHPDLVVAANVAHLPWPAAAPPAIVAGGTRPGLTIVPAADETTTTSTTTTTTTTTTVSVTTTTVPKNHGRVKILSGVAPFAELARMEGEVNDRLGRAVASTSDLSGDSVEDLWVGAIGKDVGAKVKAGVVALYTSAGSLVRTLEEPSPQAGAAFGTAVVVPGSVDGDGVDDVVASAPLATVQGKLEGGRVHAFSGLGGGLLWSRSGASASARLGQSLAGGFDYDGDGIGDVAAGAPGDAPAGRRGAGAVYVLSGVDGHTLARLAGRRGRETRLFVAGLGASRRTLVRSFDPFGHVREVNIAPLRRNKGASATLAIVDDTAAGEPEAMLLAVGSGRGATSPEVVVYRAGSGRSRLSRFLPGPVGYAGGINIAGGNLSSQDGEEIAAAPADAAGASTDVYIYYRNFTDDHGRSTWAQIHTFPLFAAGDTVGGRTVNAVGVNLAAGNLTDATGDELVAGPIVGSPAVRVFTRGGGLIDQWLAYPPEGTAGVPNVGTMVAVGDLDGGGTSEIVTAPASGQLWIRAWTANGTPLEVNGKEVSFLFTQYGPDYTGGVRLAVADVDLDGRGEIIVAPGPGLVAPILAFEADAKPTPVTGWVPFMPFGPSTRSGLMLAATDSFLRR